jgi:hypothetical protein
MKKTITTILCCITLFACKNKSTTQIGEIHSKDEKSIKIAEFLKAYEAKDTATLTSMIDANKFKYIKVSDTLNKKTWIRAIRENWMDLDSISFGSPEIITLIYIGKDTITDVKSLFKASAPVGGASHGKGYHYNEPVHFIFRWNSSKIVEILEYTNLHIMIDSYFTENNTALNKNDTVNVSKMSLIEYNKKYYK